MGTRGVLASLGLAWMLLSPLSSGVARAVTPSHTCSHRAQLLARRGFDVGRTDVAMHDVGCKKPYDIWIPARTDCARMSYRLWTSGVTHADRRRTLRSRGCVWFEDGSWGYTNRVEVNEL